MYVCVWGRERERERERERDRVRHKTSCVCGACSLVTRNRPVDFVTASFTTSYSRSSDKTHKSFVWWSTVTGRETCSYKIHWSVSRDCTSSPQCHSWELSTVREGDCFFWRTCSCARLLCFLFFFDHGGVRVSVPTISNFLQKKVKSGLVGHSWLKQDAFITNVQIFRTPLSCGAMAKLLSYRT